MELCSFQPVLANAGDTGVLIGVLFYVYVISPERWPQFTSGSGLNFIQAGIKVPKNTPKKNQIIEPGNQKKNP